MTESNYKRDINQDYFLPIREFKFNPSFHWSVARYEEQRLAESLHKRYPEIYEMNFLRLIMYAGRALGLASEVDIKLYYSDMEEIGTFEEDPFNIDRVVFRGYSKEAGFTKSFEITNPYMVDQLYHALMELFDFKSIIKDKQSRKKPLSGDIIKLIGTEIYGNLIKYDGISRWKADCILAQIFSIFSIGLRVDEPLMTEQQYQEHCSKMKDLDIKTVSYLTYCRGQGKNYHY